MTGFEKLEMLIAKKGSRLVLGIDPSKVEIEIAAKNFKGDLEAYLMSIIDDCAEYIVALKPQLAFYEKSPEMRQMAMRLMKHAREKHGLVGILDVKRGDIANTQAHWAAADIANFSPDIVVLNAYMGGRDVVQPYLDTDKNLCVYVLVATSNPSARDFQDKLCGGLMNYQQMAMHARKIDSARIGYVIGSTKPDAIRNVRMLEAEIGMQPGHVLSPGFGRQGGDLEFVKHGGANAIYPISSGLTNPEYFPSGTKTSKEVAKLWRDEMNKAFESSIPTKTLKEHVVDLLLDAGLLVAPKTDDVALWPFLKRGRDKLKSLGLPHGDVDTMRKYLADGVLSKDDFTNLFLNLRNLMGHPELRRLMAVLYVQMIDKSGVKYDRIASVAYGAINTGDLVSYILDAPGILLRKERGEETTHSDILGDIKKGERIIMIEDVATTGSSLIKDVKMLRETFGVVVTDAYIFIKRTEEAEKAYRDNGINMHYIMDLPALRKIVGVKD